MTAVGQHLHAALRAVCGRRSRPRQSPGEIPPCQWQPATSGPSESQRVMRRPRHSNHGETTATDLLAVPGVAVGSSKRWHTSHLGRQQGERGSGSSPAWIEVGRSKRVTGWSRVVCCCTPRTSLSWPRPPVGTPLKCADSAGQRRSLQPSAISWEEVPGQQASANRERSGGDRGVWTP